MNIEGAVPTENIRSRGTRSTYLVSIDGAIVTASLCNPENSATARIAGDVLERTRWPPGPQTEAQACQRAKSCHRVFENHP